MLSTFRAVFEGKKQLFEGTYIYDKINWDVFPVLHIAMSGMGVGSDRLEHGLNELLSMEAEKHGVELQNGSTKARFSELIKKMSKKGRVVILIDEYDKALVNQLDNKPEFEANRNILGQFYGILKDHDE